MTTIIRIDKEGYLQKLSLSSRKRSFLHTFLDTQMFERFIHQAAALLPDGDTNGNRRNALSPSSSPSRSLITTKPTMIHHRSYSTSPTLSSPTSSSSWAALFEQYVLERKLRHRYNRSGKKINDKNDNGQYVSNNQSNKGNGCEFGKINGHCKSSNNYDEKNDETAAAAGLHKKSRENSMIANNGLCYSQSPPLICTISCGSDGGERDNSGEVSKEKDDVVYTFPNKFENEQKLVSYASSKNRRSPLTVTAPVRPNYYYVDDDDDENGHNYQNESNTIITGDDDDAIHGDDAWTSWCSSMFCFFGTK